MSGKPRGRRRQHALEWLDRRSRAGILPMHVYVELRADIEHGDLRLFEAFEFFLEYYEGWNIYHQDQPGAALLSARAEAYAKARGWKVVWEQDRDAKLDLEVEYHTIRVPAPHVVQAVLLDEQGNVRGIAGNIREDSMRPIVRANRRRDVEAGLVINAMPSGPWR